MKILEDYNKLMKVIVKKTGNTQYSFWVEDSAGAIIPDKNFVFKGDKAELRTLLIRLKASDDVNNPKSKRSIAYSQIVNSINEISKFTLWIFSSKWNTYCEETN